MPATLEVRREGAAAVFEINRPEDHNRIDMATMDAMIEQVGVIDRDASVRALVLTGRGEYFCAGGRIGGYPVGKLQDQLDYARAFTVLQERLGRSRVPVVAAVNGHCLAGGMSLLEAADLAIAADTAQYAYPEIENGLFPMLAMAVARRGLPPKIAFDLFYSGRRIDAAEALRLNLINAAVPSERLWDAVRARVAELERRSGGAMMVGRQAYYAMGNMTTTAALEYAQTALIASLRAAEDAKAG
ncbi:putative enoyl-CoA hydratase echA8 [Methylobacterium crusticola]|uniref:Enoyl-CoA hydratase echA8 n=1 Tax=Methylobacterium crusticola TaxID=1697972 RepID=A0ABQ4R3G4_9HYPH|nr:enoyl-CoA hydratase/isomerase family protein [Methylobacterium crusticola]GJD52168.1 putative enoyl-CoA hydratase echA8 [Methylobacterium crusticola]